MNANELQDILESVSDESIAEYKELGPQLLREINHWITDKKQTTRFLGDNSVDLLLNNHRNHHGFISQILTLRDAKGLVKALPWVYNTYHSQGVPLDYFKEELQQWINAIQDHIKSDTNNTIEQLYLWMLGTHDQRCQEILNIEQKDFLPPDHPFLKDIIKGNHRGAFSYAQKHVSNWGEFETFFCEVAQPALYEIGLLWEKGFVSVASEHLATAVVNRVLSGLLYNIELPDVTRPKVLVSCIANEYHQIGPWMVSTVLEANGWDVDFLGADTPTDTIIDIIKEEQYNALLLSITMPYNLENAQYLIAKAREKCPDLKIIAGGQAFSFITDPNHSFPADLVVTSYDEAVNALNSWEQ